MTTATSKTKPGSPSRFARIYATGWLVLATFALGYLVVLAAQPSLLGRAVTAEEPGASSSHPAIERFATDLTGVKQSVTEIRQEVATLRSAIDAGTAREREIVGRLAAVEQQPKAVAVAEAASPPPAAPKTVAQQRAEARAKREADRAAAALAAKQQQPQQPAPVTAVDVAAATTGVTVLNAAPPQSAAATSPLATGSIGAPAQGVPAPPPPTKVAPFGPGAVKAAAPAQVSAVELSSGPSLDALRLNWSLLSEQNGPLRSLEPRYMNAGEGQPYQLVAGPIGSPEEAARVCAQLKAKRVTCKVTGFGGNAL